MSTSVPLAAANAPARERHEPANEPMRRPPRVYRVSDHGTDTEEGLAILGAWLRDLLTAA